MRQDPNAPLLSVRNVSKRFPLNRVRERYIVDLLRRIARAPIPRRQPADQYFWPLQDVTFDLHAGETLGLIGENGSGKSTLLKVIGHILEPTAGEVVVRGRVAALLELGAGFHPDLTGRENIYLNGSILGLSRNEVTDYIEQIIEFADIGPFIDSPVKHYSSGMRVRLGFSIAVHVKPDLLLVDEVLAVGDENFQHKCLEAFYEFGQRGGALLLVSHSLEQLREMCRRIVWLDAGRVRADGPAEEVIARYLRYVHGKERQRIQRTAFQQTKGLSVEPCQPADSRNGAGGQLANGHGEVLRWGDGKVKIGSVQLLNSEGVPTPLFETGDTLTLDIEYEVCNELAGPPIVGVAFVRHDNLWCYGTNSDIDRIDTDMLCLPEYRRGRVHVNIASLPLLAGHYTIDVAFQNRFGGEHDYWRRCVDLTVRSMLKDAGVSRIDHEWRFQASLSDEAAANSVTNLVE